MIGAVPCTIWIMIHYRGPLESSKASLKPYKNTNSWVGQRQHLLTPACLLLLHSVGFQCPRADVDEAEVIDRMESFILAFLEETFMHGAAPDLCLARTWHSLWACISHSINVQWRPGQSLSLAKCSKTHLGHAGFFSTSKR